MIKLVVNTESGNFGSIAKEQFSFLEDYGFSLSRECSTLLEYQKGNVQLGVYLGRTSLEVGFYVSIGDEKYYLSQLIKIVDEAAGQKYRNPIAGSVSSLPRCIAQVSQAVRNYCHRLLTGDNEIFGELKSAAEMWKKNYALEVLAKQVLPRANAAFRKQKYEEAAALYLQVKPILSPSEVKKLSFAIVKSSEK